MEEDLIQAALADAGLAALFGDRIHWNARPQGQRGDALVFRTVAGGDDYTYAGQSGLAGPLVQADLYTATATAMVAGKRALRAFLATLTMAPWQGAFVEADRDTFDPDTTPGSTDHHASLDVSLWHHPASA